MAYGKIAAIGTFPTHLGTCKNDTVLMTDNNLVCFTSRFIGITCANRVHILTMPSTIPVPLELLRFPALYWESGTGYKVGGFLWSNDHIETLQALNNAEVYFDGLVLSMNNQFYSAALGNNNESNFTSPVDAR